MGLELVKQGFDSAQKSRRWVLLLGALGITSYGLYGVYHLPPVVRKRRKLRRLLGALISIAEAVSDSAEAIGVVSKDLKEFVQSDSDQIPNSLRQMCKITRSDEFSESVITVTRALSVGIMRGYRSEARNDAMSANSSLTDRLLDKLFSTAGSGFASVVVGSLAKNLVLAFYSDREIGQELNIIHSNDSTSLDHNASESPSVPDWVNVLCGDKCRELIGECAQLFVSTAMAVYLDKTMHINTCDEIFSGLTNPRHEREMTDMLTSICNRAVETFVRTSKQVLTDDNSNLNLNSSNLSLANDSFESQATPKKELLGHESPSTEQKASESSDENEDNWWVNKISNTLAVPSNRKLFLEVTGMVTFETVRSFLEFLMDRLCDALRSGLAVIHEAVVERGQRIVRYLTVKSSAMFTLCISLCMHVLGGTWILVLA